MNKNIHGKIYTVILLLSGLFFCPLGYAALDCDQFADHQEKMDICKKINAATDAAKKKDQAYFERTPRSQPVKALPTGPNPMPGQPQPAPPQTQPVAPVPQAQVPQVAPKIIPSVPQPPKAPSTSQPGQGNRVKYY